MTYPEGKVLFVTSGENVMSNCESSLPSSDQEEADSRMLLHILYALQKNMTFICIMSNDTDIVILALGKHHYL